MLIKRNAFIYEDELRICIVKQNATLDKGIQFHYNCPPTDIVQDITLCPNFNNITLEQILSQDTKIGGYGFSPLLNKKGVMQKRVLRSRLYDYKHPSYINI